jgi:MFS family permease
MIETTRWSLLRNRDFALVCGARFAVTLAIHVINVAIGWYIYDVTGSAYALAYLGIAGLIPALALVLPAGYVADHYDRRLILFCADIVLTLTGLALLALVASQSGLVWPVYFIIAFVSASRAFHNPAGQAIVPALVPAEQLSSAIALSSSIFQAAQIFGPALGGILYALDARLPFIVASLLYAVSGVAALCIGHRSAPAAGNKVPLTIKSLMAGFEFAWSKPVVFGAVALDASVVMLGGVVVLLPVFAKDILHVGAQGLGLLRAAPAAGAVLMALWLANNDFVKRGTGRKLFATIAIYGIAITLFGLSSSFILSLILLVVVGASDMISVVIRHTMVQAETPDHLRGRVAAVNSLFLSASSELSQFRAGMVAGFLGAIPAVVIGGVIAASLSVIWPRLFPNLAARDHLVDPQTPPRTTQGAKA